jgi:hypothetical protein
VVRLAFFACPEAFLAVLARAAGNRGQVKNLEVVEAVSDAVGDPLVVASRDDHPADAWPVRFYRERDSLPGRVARAEGVVVKHAPGRVEEDDFPNLVPVEVDSREPDARNRVIDFLEIEYDCEALGVSVLLARLLAQVQRVSQDDSVSAGAVLHHYLVVGKDVRVGFVHVRPLDRIRD